MLDFVSIRSRQTRGHHTLLNTPTCDMIALKFGEVILKLGIGYPQLVVIAQVNSLKLTLIEYTTYASHHGIYIGNGLDKVIFRTQTKCLNGFVNRSNI